MMQCACLKLQPAPRSGSPNDRAVTSRGDFGTGVVLSQALIDLLQFEAVLHQVLESDAEVK